MRALLTLTLASLSATTAIGAQQAPPAALPVKAMQMPPFQEATLLNGMRLIVVENHKQPVLAVSLAFSAGRFYDPAGKSGTAEAVAGLLNKGAGARVADAFSAAIEGVGGSFSASAGTDFLTLSTNVLSRDAALAFELLSDAARRPTFDTKEVELLRTQTLSGLKLEEAQPDAILAKYRAATLFGAHPYGRRADAKSVAAITRDDIVAFHKAHVQPSGALLVVAGDVTLAQATSWATKAFGDWTGTVAASAAPAAPPARTKTEILLVHRPGSVQTNISISNLTWRPNDPRGTAAEVANQVLGGGSESRLFLMLREKKGWTYGSYSSLDDNLRAGTFEATAEVRTAVTDSSLVELLSQMKAITSQLVPTKEFNDSRGGLVGRFPLQMQTASAVAGAVASAKLLGRPANYVATYRQQLAAVTPVQALAAAKAAIRPQEALIVLVGDGAAIYDKVKGIAPTTIIDVTGKMLTPGDLVMKATALDLDAAQLQARSDSFVVFLQGNPFGFQRSTTTKSAEGWTYTENTVIGPIVNQSTTSIVGNDLMLKSVKQVAKMQGMDFGIDVTVADGKATGSAKTPSPTGGVNDVKVDVALPAGAVDDNFLSFIVPALKLSAGAKIPLTVFQSGKGALSPQTVSVVGEESVTVPAGTFESWKLELTGGEAPVTMWVSKATPRRIVK
ncbi:MAG: insulinase family protein, partial [Gemmatimonadaceae bacterium]|nr:insulinase family protein [Gemmatimonadaceae bacterium]